MRFVVATTDQQVLSYAYAAQIGNQRRTRRDPHFNVRPRARCYSTGRRI